jgi:LacI family transcriptional regulator
MSIVGFENMRFVELADPPLTTINLSGEVLGRAVVDALMATIEKPGQQGVEVLIPTHLVVRESTASPKSGT